MKRISNTMEGSFGWRVREAVLGSVPRKQILRLKIPVLLGNVPRRRLVGE